MYTDAVPDETTELRQGDIFIELPWPLFDAFQAIGSGKTEINIATSGLSASQRFVIPDTLRPR